MVAANPNPSNRDNSGPNGGTHSQPSEMDGNSHPDQKFQQPTISQPNTSQQLSGRMPETSMLRLKEFIKDSSAQDSFGITLSNQPGELTTFQAYSLMEVVLLSDRTIPEKVTFLDELQKYVVTRSAYLHVHTPSTPTEEREYLFKVEQIRDMLAMCIRVQDILSATLEYPTQLQRLMGIAGLQDNLRQVYLERGIPVEDRRDYTDPQIPGRNFLSGKMEVINGPSTR